MIGFFTFPKDVIENSYYCTLYHVIPLPPQSLVACGADAALVAILPVASVRVERLLDEYQVVVAEAEAVKEGRAVLVAARDRGDDL